MNKIWEIVTDIFIGIIIIFISVMLYFGLKTETVLRSFYNKNVDEFLDNVKRNGVITISDYEKFLSKMDIGGNIFDINLEHRFKILEPEYRFRTLEEIIDEQKRNYTGPNEYHYREVITERPHVDDPINDGNLNTETNESVLEKAINGPADPNHVHDENCYSGHKHKDEPYFIHTHQHTYSCVEFVDLMYCDYRCLSCGIYNHRFLASYYWDEETRSVKLAMSWGGTAECMACGSRSLADIQYKRGYGYSCGYTIDINNDGYNDQVGRDVAYQYRKSFPPPRNVKTKQNYTSGCYFYHEKGYIPVSYTNYYGTPYFDGYYIYELLTNGFNSYCTFPATIELYYRYGNDSTDYYTIEFRPDKQPDGSFIFRCYPGSNLSIYETFPAVDFNRFKQICTSSSELYNYLKENVKRKVIISGGYRSETKMYGVYQNCNEPVHDRWINTCGFEEDKTVDCNHIIVSLTPTHENQTVYVNDPLITTAVATYKDGSTKTVVCTTDFSTSSLVKDQDVTLIYNYTIDGKNYSISCKIKVSVIPRNKTCSKGHTYNLNSDGTDPGCPYCKAWIESLRVIRPETSPIVITIGTTLQDNGVVLLATYMDGHTEEVTSGYTDNLDKNYLGTMQVTIGYKGASITVLVTTVCKKIVCDICGYEYDLYPDGTNPGCPNCIRKIPVFTGNIMEYEHINHSEEILETLYDRGEYILNIDDIFTVTVKNKTSNIARMLLRKIYPSLSERWCLINKSEYILKR